VPWSFKEFSGSRQGASGLIYALEVWQTVNYQDPNAGLCADACASGWSKAYTGTTFATSGSGVYNFLHGRGGNYLWCDGHVSFMTYADVVSISGGTGETIETGILNRPFSL
jgi:prepilin-type processing-associated H-X9-DG protein